MKVQISLKLDAGLKKRLQKLADKDNRSFSNYIENALMAHADNSEIKMIACYGCGKKISKSELTQLHIEGYDEVHYYCKSCLSKSEVQIK